MLPAVIGLPRLFRYRFVPRAISRWLRPPSGMERRLSAWAAGASKWLSLTTTARTIRTLSDCSMFSQAQRAGDVLPDWPLRAAATGYRARVAKDGHVVGNHTFTHPLLIFKSAAQIRSELKACQRALHDAVGEHSNLFRPPFGGRRPAVLRIARQMGLAPVMWNVTGYDWNAPPAEYIEGKVTRRVRGGNVILLHDGSHLAMGADRAQTVMATDNLIRRYRHLGYEFVTVEGMFAVSHQPSVAG